MENQTGFNLNHALASWRAGIASQPGVTDDNVRELESHLQEAFAEIKAKGLREEEAFFLAQRRLGSADELAAEWHKADPTRVWRERVFWMVTGVVSVNILFNLAYLPWRYIGQGRFGGWGALWMVTVYMVIAGLALSIARGNLNGVVNTLGRLLNSRLKMTLVIVLAVFCQTTTFWFRLLNVLFSSNARVAQGPYMLQPWYSMVLNAVWPLVLCAILFRLWNPAPSRRPLPTN